MLFETALIQAVLFCKYCKILIIIEIDVLQNTDLYLKYKEKNYYAEK